MDIDFLWSLGGCIRFLHPRNCMATSLMRINSSSSSSSPSPFSLLEIPTKPHHFFFFFGLLFVLLAVVSSSGSDPSVTAAASSALPPHETLFSGERAAAKTVDFQPRKKASNPHASKPKGYKDDDGDRRQFEASDHEVPSGPNPISNR
ncbi:CLAVATA3/ESR (CLE)-related protein TDIF [Sesamum indicum]|uniref:CLAVATA3/ESR (CLE)-related protein TDIF n=1 Tax=Sesamum indicum TaxID=4182 RepID=A0A6I9TC95_SESIN|nr:CLAVATA3/ESR (CLE)-related protein TDIF [Sesamum indicum]